MPTDPIDELTRTAIARHCRELDRCNQRGGRMLSLPDLLEAGSLDLDLGAFLLEQMLRGASILVGARPGGAGKTTVMCALLNALKPGIELVPATSEILRQNPQAPGQRCYICHEIGAGSYYAYLWGSRLRAYCALADQGCCLASNLHADDLEEARAQLCLENGVPEAHFNAFDLVLFLRVDGWGRGGRHWIEKVYQSHDRARHQLCFDTHQGMMESAAPGPFRAQCRAFLETLHNNGIRTIEDFRINLLDWQRSQQLDEAPA